MTKKTTDKQRLRAPSKRSLASRSRILDAAETVFARDGFEGAKVRDIAALAEVPLGLVNHHGGSKEALFREVVERRAEELTQLRLEALAGAKGQGALSLDVILECFFRPYLAKAAGSDPQWLAYARLVAMVSADPAWADISADLFDPTAQRFIEEICALYPGVRCSVVAEGFVYSVAALLAFLTSEWRVAALAATTGPQASVEGLIAFCSAGCAARIAQAKSEARQC
ncbi:MAG: TetR/AcrR family transcriptional regulator [Thioclava marina]|jgi:AcrR family transcriptional regulator|uniref:TetR/AcrR family transcriptional regulator n=1 Tax=Thioclava marina TaxID=1915077 RepID=UPI0019A6DD35|nr:MULTISPECIES: TetR/AcrR family transcriptional regulator [Thioclava]MBC7143861.1 TetR/AcrR family transcriptional regulator [Thioclava marina]MBD3802755.1 TetR/AcrR family transcriptional regulator [Thioclava sp.]